MSANPIGTINRYDQEQKDAEKAASGRDEIEGHEIAECTDYDVPPQVDLLEK